MALPGIGQLWRARAQATFKSSALNYSATFLPSVVSRSAKPQGESVAIAAKA